MGRGPATGYVVTDQPDGNRVATSSVRPAVVCDVWPERVEATAPLPLSGSHAALVGKRPELVVVSSRMVKLAKQFQPLRQVDPMSEGIRDAVLFLSATSVEIMMRRWVGIPRLGQGCLVERTVRSGWVVVPAGAPRAEPANASAWVRTKRR